jgi:chemotaxis protein histidine kinase CheA
MPAPTTPDPNEIDLVELQLQQELHAMFEVESQKYLEDYLNLVQGLNSQTWIKDIQESYRLIHTIKGSSVTVGANAILLVSTVLEDMLSDLRHINPPPPLEDGCLGQMLLEAGELLAGSLQVRLSGEQAIESVQPSVKRIQAMREEAKQRYLPDWNEQSLLHQEFAEQGFGLVILELEMVLEQMPKQGEVSNQTVEVAQQTILQLKEIGKDLQFESGWTQLLGQCEDLFNHPSPQVWRSQWTSYLNALKESARGGGKFVEPVATTITETLAEETFSDLELLELSEFDSSLLDFEEFGEVVAPSVSTQESENLDFDELAIASNEFTLTDDEFIELDETADLLAQLETNAIAETVKPLSLELEEQAPSLDPSEISENWLDLVTPSLEDESTIHADLPPSEIAPTLTQSPSIVPTIRPEPQNKDIQIPVPLNRLDSTAQNLIDTLLTARASQGFYQNLQVQLTQLFALAKESTQYITRLRQLQDDYALLDNLKSNSDSTKGPTLERYRQGYTTINRLLETSLRLSELGAEAEKTSLLTADSLQNLDRNILRLRQTVEQSRLVPFKNLAFRARAVLRDLTTRFDKLARLILEGEQIELDAGTNSKLEAALLHLIRNAYDHGIESVEERIARGKPEQGTIAVSLIRRGNFYLLDVSDDGGGIDAVEIARSAQAKRLPLTNTQTPAELLAVLCQPGFSSKTSVSEISGRGVGMDVVADRVASLGGRLSLYTMLGQGTSFRLQFPVPHLLVPCILLQAGDRTLAIPSQDITTTRILGNLQVTKVSDANTACSWTIDDGEKTSPGLDLLEYWQSQSAERSLSDTAVCLYIRPTTISEGIWILADELLGQTELLISPLPSPLVAPIGLLGASLQPNGSLVPVVDAATLAEVLLSGGCVSESILVQTATEIQSSDSKAIDPETVTKLTRTILVVDDAALMRRRIEASLTAYGYSVNTCADGQEALNWLQNNPTPAMVITDIEMPNMDGFTLIDRARQAGIKIPMIVVSSRLAQEWSKEARRLGATDYLTKGFSTPELINKVKSLL